MTDQWLEISLIVDGELAEAVAEVLARFSPDGVVIESTLIDPNGSPEGTVVGPLRVAAYLPVDAGRSPMVLGAHSTTPQPTI